MSDDWKGEHFIRRRPTDAQRRSASCSAISSTIAEINRRKGLKPANAKQHGRIVSRALGQMHQVLRLEAAAKRD